MKYRIKAKYAEGAKRPPAVDVRMVKKDGQNVKEITHPDGKVTHIGYKLFRQLYEKVDNE